MLLHEITAESMTEALGSEVPEIYVVIAKHSVMGMDAEGIRQVLGVELSDIVEVEADPLYKLVRQQCGAAQSQTAVSQTTGWDAMEQMAIQGLLKRLPFEKDSEFLLRVAAVANRATRKTQQDKNVLDPTQSNGKVVVTLTQRLVQRLNKPEMVEETRQLSIHDGSMSRPNFEELDSMLSVRNQPALPRAVEIQTRTVDPSMDELMEDMLKR